MVIFHSYVSLPEGKWVNWMVYDGKSDNQMDENWGTPMDWKPPYWKTYETL